jgi:glycosyltransferase involved in cell wall biosynthesis
MDQIFVQIASYRDVELPRTINSALAAAKYPGRITFGICWQYDEASYLDLDPFVDDCRFRISQFYYEESEGCCWARNQSNLLYSGEKYTLQIDAHTRFACDWDERFINMLEGLDLDKPLLSTYPAPFDYLDGIERRYSDRGMQRLVMNRMHKNLTTVFSGEPVDDRSRPAPSPFLAAGQIFTIGRFCEEVEYDPQLYFSGEEISLSARAYTHGYDVYCPNEDLLWHLYQHSMPLHSADHRDNQNEVAIKRLNTLFLDDHTKLGKYGFGSQRSLAEYEQFANLDFAGRLNRKTQATHLKMTLPLNLTKIAERDDYDFWVFTLRNIDDEEIYRRDLTVSELPSRGSASIDLDVELEDRPVSYGLWPHTLKDGFLDRYFQDYGF